MDINEILDILPQKYPFLLVDRLLSFEPPNKATVLKNVTINEAFFQGHFPGNPIMPGVLIIEAMAQAGGLLIYHIDNKMKGVPLYFAGINNARFRHQVIPGDQLIFKIEMLRHKMGTWKMQANAFVDDRLVAEAQLLASS